jgi:hypothetical protein
MSIASSSIFRLSHDLGGVGVTVLNLSTRSTSPCRCGKDVEPLSSHGTMADLDEDLVQEHRILYALISDRLLLIRRNNRLASGGGYGRALNTWLMLVRGL